MSDTTAIAAHHHDGPGYGEPCATCGGHQNHAIHALGNTDTYIRSPRNGRLRNLRKRRENYETRSITVRDEPEASETCPGGAADVERKATALLVSECNERTVEQDADGNP